MVSKQDASRTLRELVENRRDADRPTHIHVVGDLNRDPPKGLATAKRVAHLLVDKDGTVREDNFGDLDDGDVAFVRIDEPPVRFYEKHEELRQLVHLSRASSLAGIVVFTETVDKATEQLLDARVWAEAGGVDRIEQLLVSSYDGVVYARELEGLHG